MVTVVTGVIDGDDREGSMTGPGYGYTNLVWLPWCKGKRSNFGPMDGRNKVSTEKCVKGMDGTLFFTLREVVLPSGMVSFLRVGSLSVAFTACS